MDTTAYNAAIAWIVKWRTQNQEVPNLQCIVPGSQKSMEQESSTFIDDLASAGSLAGEGEDSTASVRC